MWLRICTPLLPLPPLSRTWHDSSKSPYSFLLHRNVLKLIPLPVSPTMAPSETFQYSSPSQPSVFLPLKNSDVSSPREPPAHKQTMQTALSRTFLMTFLP